MGSIAEEIRQLRLAMGNCQTMPPELVPDRVTDYTPNDAASDSVPVEVTPCMRAWLVLDEIAGRVDELAKVADSPLFNLATTVMIFGTYVLSPVVSLFTKLTAAEAAQLWSGANSLVSSGGAGALVSAADYIRSGGEGIPCVAAALVNGDGAADKYALARAAALGVPDMGVATLLYACLFEDKIQIAFYGVTLADYSTAYNVGEGRVSFDCACLPAEIPAGTTFAEGERGTILPSVDAYYYRWYEVTAFDAGSYGDFVVRLTDDANFRLYAYEVVSYSPLGSYQTLRATLDGVVVRASANGASLTDELAVLGNQQIDYFRVLGDDVPAAVLRFVIAPG